ncbi:MAG TPA: HAMP domain-containing sensor histidine kinase [Gemmatimonadaceae bacterium]|jgi:two-component system OmpR family sensor kinase|nr:HAMP domain-containing sensor histidine kinase [Gemmatimonadaceae bacterium]
MATSIRAQLTATYATALLVTLAAFGGVLLAARQSAQERELAQRVAAEADLAVRIVRQAAAAGDPVTAVSDPRIGPVVTPKLRTLLEGVPDYVLVLDSAGRTLYNSFAIRQLDDDDQVALSRAAIVLPPSGPPRPINLRDRRLLVLALSDPGHVGGVARIVAGVELDQPTIAPYDLGGTLLLAAPVILLVSVGAAYMIAGRAFRPVEIIINEVEAITDGRSLHRRLALDDSSDELTRLARTLNAMMGRLETSFAALRRFTADASHELKTPLTVLRADVERAMSANPHTTEQLVALEEALRETRRMADLVDSLLTLARADEGRFDLVREPVDLEPLAREIYETAVILGEDAGITVSMPVLEAVTVLGDRERLRQLFMNLVVNAIKYTARGGRVDLSLSQRLHSATFTVRDTGIGIAAGDLPYIFERFWRADRVRSRGSERGGFGLGLAIGQYIAQAHGGSLTVTSRLGRGSVFTVTLPDVTVTDFTKS